MVLGNVFDDWRKRLAILRAARSSPATEIEAWLIEIRIRILGYLVSRYGGGEVDADPDAEADRRFDLLFREERPRRPGQLDPADRWYGVDHPPQAAAEMTPALHRIRELNQCVRLRIGRPDPETAWQWWADTYCRAGSTPPRGTLADADRRPRPAG